MSKSTRRQTMTRAGALALAALGVTAASVRAEPEKHPHIRAAIKELRDAKKELETADHDFGGHRVNAIKAIDHAIEQLEKALKFDKK
jgi:hypothetical protein